MEIEPDKIDYQILDDGTCSYCGRQVGMVELPDGSYDWDSECIACEEYNQEALLEACLELMES